MKLEFYITGSSFYIKPYSCSFLSHPTELCRDCGTKDWFKDYLEVGSLFVIFSKTIS